MAFNYQPFLIANLQYGLELGLQPWLLPQDGFVQLQNGYLSRGVLRKRQGHEAFGRLVHAVGDEVMGTGDAGGTKTFTGTLDHYPLRPGDLEVTDGVETFSDNGDGSLTGDAGGTGTIDYATGDFSVTFNVAPGNGVEVLGSYNYFPGLPCMGMWNYTNAAGGQDYIAFNTKRINKYNVATCLFEDVLGFDLWTGEDYEFFWLANWLNRAFITNGKDWVQVFDGASLISLLVNLNDNQPDRWESNTAYSLDDEVLPTTNNGYYYKCTTAGTSGASEPTWGKVLGGTTNDGTAVWTCYDQNDYNDLNSAQLIFPFKNRVVLLNTVEEGATYAQRARWSPVGKFTDWVPTDYVDAPTHEWIMGAGWIKNDLVVWFERSIWALRYTGDVRLPFRWVRLVSNEGLISKMALADFSDEILGMGPTRLVGTDGLESYNVDQRIPQLILSINQSKLGYCFAAVLDEADQMWLSYPSLAAELPDQILVLNYEEKSFGRFLLPMFVFGYFDRQADLTWDDIEETWDEIEWTWDDRSLQAGYPLLLGGDYQGYIWQMNSGGSDNGAAIEFSVKTGRGNPFIKKGLKARLGWVDFLVDRDPGISLTINYFINHESSPCMSDTFVCDDGSEDEKIWIRSYVGCEAEFHQLQIYNKAVGQTPAIHAVMPWFCAGGGIH